MRIGIITTQYAPNYGALLQAFSLQNYLRKSYEFAVVFDIDYWPEYTRDFWKVIRKRKGIKNKLLNIYFLMHPGMIKARRELLKAMWDFRNNYISCTKPYYSESDLKDNPDHLDVVICGSDQVWNVSRPEYSSVNFLAFAENWNAKVISYAPSVATRIPDSKKEELQRYLERFDAISVREANDIEQIQKLTNLPVKHVCDPVFLTSAKEWESLIPHRQIDDRYILCYFISVGEFAPKVVDKIRELTGLKVVHINVNARDKFHSEYDIRNANPFELVSYIKNADYICTNSFHCTAFSVLFRKKLVVVKKDVANSRMESLLQLAGATNAFIGNDELSSLTLEKMNTQYEIDRINEWIEQSKDYLINSLGIEGSN